MRMADRYPTISVKTDEMRREWWNPMVKEITRRPKKAATEAAEE